MENATHTVLEFWRPYATCDLDNDLEIYDNEWEMANIVFAYSFLDPAEERFEDISEAAYRGATHIYFFDYAENSEHKENNIEIIQPGINVRPIE